MEENLLKKLNIRVVWVLVFLVIMILLVFASMLAQIFFDIGGSNDSGGGGFKYFIWIFLLVLSIFVLMLFWNMKTRKSYNLKFKKRQILLIYSAIWLGVFLMMDYKKISTREIMIAGLIIVIGMLHFFFVNHLRLYSSRVLHAITIGVSLFLLQIFMSSCYFVISSVDHFTIKEVLNSFIGYTFQILPRIIILLPIVFVFSFLITIVAFGRVGSKEALDSEHINKSNSF